MMRNGGHEMNWRGVGVEQKDDNCFQQIETITKKAKKNLTQFNGLPEATNIWMSEENVIK